jgi:hypothetical protein
MTGCSRERRKTPPAAGPQPPAETVVEQKPRTSTGNSGALRVEQPTSHEPGKLKPYTVSPDLKEVSNLKTFEKALPLSAAQKEVLGKNLFVAGCAPYKQLFHVYENNDYLNLPSFVTTDVALHLYHCFFDYALRTIEQAKLTPLLSQMTSACLADTNRQLAQARVGAVRSALVKNAAYFGVAAKLLGLPDRIPAQAQNLVKRELALINAHGGFGKGAILPYQIDYSQFVPRGHYTRTPQLKRFFMGMMWYGLTPFATRFGDGTSCPEAVRQGVLICRTLDRAGMLLNWGNVYEPTTFFVGASDDQIPPQWVAVADRVFGRGSGPDAVADPARLRQFITEVEHLPVARIRAEMTGGKEVPGPKWQLRIMGQRYIPDSEVLQRLSKPYVRPFPSGLDVMAVLGSRRAAQILDDSPSIYNPNKWPQYAEERARLVAQFRDIPVRQWTSNLYWSWLHSLQPLLDSLPDGYPSFMTSGAWRDKSLNTALASWTELRHDTILYGKQSAVECGDGEQRPLPTGYVEPNVPLYDRLLKLLGRTQEVVAKNDLMTDALKTGFEEFGGLLQFLKKCSQKELRGELLSEEENREIRYIGGKIEFLTRSTIEGAPQYWELVDKSDQDMALVADVHTAAPKVLEEGVGRAAEIFVIVPIGKKLVLTRGAIFTYYEFTHPMSGRLTDEKWRALLDTPEAPEPPAWTKSFLLPSSPPDPNRERKEGYNSGC